MRLLLIAAFVLPEIAFAATNFASALAPFGILVGPPFQSLSVQEVEMKGSHWNERTLQGDAASGVHIQIKIISPIEGRLAQSLIEDESAGFKKLFAAPAEPYMADIAEAVGGCNARFGPMQKNVPFLGGDKTLLIGAATADYGFGACQSERARYRGAELAYYDPTAKTLWMWRLFSPWKDRRAKLDDGWWRMPLEAFRK